MAANIDAVTIELNTGHASIVSQPKLVASFIGHAAMALSGELVLAPQLLKHWRARAATSCFAAVTHNLVERLKGSLPVDAGEVRGEVVDVTNRDHLETWFAKMDKADIVISTVSALSPDWETSWQADVTGTLNVLAVAEAKLKQSKVGAFTYVGSKASSFATPGFESYGACKAAMAHVVKSTAIRLAAEGVRMNVVSPGDTFEEGGFWDNIRTNAPDVYQQTLAGNPFGRLATRPNGCVYLQPAGQFRVRCKLVC
ncbi:Isoepoxydon dehydrogenase patN [Nymphon striatum]|nr:Isoepoxydon dehydrogenase patN [Nymphon striatum]